MRSDCFTAEQSIKNNGREFIPDRIFYLRLFVRTDVLLPDNLMLPRKAPNNEHGRVIIEISRLPPILSLSVGLSIKEMISISTRYIAPEKSPVIIGLPLSDLADINPQTKKDI